MSKKARGDDRTVHIELSTSLSLYSTDLDDLVARNCDTCGRGRRPVAVNSPAAERGFEFAHRFSFLAA
jgi:hypothetical protein